MGKQAVTVIWKSILIILAGAVVGTLLLAAAFSCPVNEEKRLADYQVMEKEGWYPSVLIHSLSLDEYFTSYEPGILDNGTDIIMLYTALDTSAEGNAFQRAMNGYSTYLKINYSYYWHGYVSVLRPILYLIEYDDLRFYNCIGQFAVIFFLCMAVKKRTGRTEHVLLLMTSYILLMPQALAMSLQFTWVFYIGTIGCLVLIRKNEWFEQNFRYVYLFVVTGLLTSYFDLLTYPLFTWGFPLLWWLVTGNRDITGLKRLWRVVISGIGWIAGYALMWVMKWAAGSLILGRDLFEGAINEVFVQSGTREDLTMDILTRLNAVYQNWRHYEYSVYAVILTAWLVWAAYKALKNGWHSSRDDYAYLLVGASSIVWYMALANHTAGHHFFTYRIFNVSVTAFLLLIVGSVIPYREDGGVQIRSKRGRRLTALCGALLSVAAGGCSFLAREEIPVTNAQCPSELMELSEGEALEFQFTPAYSRLRNICVCLSADKPDGALEISVSRQGETLYCETVDIERFEESDYDYVPVEWDLRAGESYTVCYTVTGNDGPVRLALTEPGNAPLQEIRQVVLNGEQTDGQPVVILAYWNRPIVKTRLLFLAFSWIGLLTGIAVTVYTALTEMGKERQRYLK